MSDFHDEKEHSQEAYLFDSVSNEDAFKSNTTIPYKVLKGRREKQIYAMMNSHSELGSHMLRLQTSAITGIYLATSPEEALAIQIGLFKIEPSGFCICKACLDKLIITCTETLHILEDIKEAIENDNG